MAEGLLERNAAADIVAVEELPDGRRLVVFSDRREIVVGVARPRPHPVPGVDWLWARPEPSDPPRLRLTERGRREIRTLPDARDSIVPGTRSRRRRTWAAEQRAEELLRSLLDPAQLHDWETTGGFWVETPQGAVRLGHLYSLVHRPPDCPGEERILCAVPDCYTELPIADIWSNLLLVLAVEPDEFFRVAILRGTRLRPTVSHAPDAAF